MSKRWEKASCQVAEQHSIERVTGVNHKGCDIHILSLGYYF
jgi:hypothetical protein